MIVDHPMINKYINTARMNLFYNHSITDSQRKHFLIFANKCRNAIGSNLDDYESQVVHLLMLRHYFITCV